MFLESESYSLLNRISALADGDRNDDEATTTTSTNIVTSKERGKEKPEKTNTSLNDNRGSEVRQEGGISSAIHSTTSISFSL